MGMTPGRSGRSPKGTRLPKPTTIQLRVALLGIRPPIWRRVLVPSNGSGEYLHQVIQTAMGWQDGHLHHFILGKRPNLIMVEQPDTLDEPMFGGSDEDTLDSTKITIGELLRRGGGRVLYEYDFGDGWMHDVKLEKESDLARDQTLPWCLGGARACPPEDSGGVGGYAEIVRMVQDPKYKPEGQSRQEMIEWLGGEYDPELFDLNEVNEQFRPREAKRRKGTKSP